VNPNNTTPYANLDPSLILDAIESIGYHCSGGLLALNSYENRVYQVGIEDDAPLIAKFYRPHRWSDAAILEEHEFSTELLQHEIPVVAPINIAGKTLHHYRDYRFSVFPRKGGRALELDNIEQLEWMGRFIARIHAVGAIKPFAHRPTLDAKTHGYTPYHFLIKHNFIPDSLQKFYSQTVEALLEKIEQRFQQASPITYIRLHGDFHAGNILWNDTGPQIVDLDDSLMGPAIQDIWMLLSGNEEQRRFQLNRILDGYCEFYDYNPREIHLIEALRSLRMIQYAAWLAVRWEDPAFPRSFPWFNTLHYWQEHINHLNDQLIMLGSVDNSLD